MSVHSRVLTFLINRTGSCPTLAVTLSAAICTSNNTRLQAALLLRAHKQTEEETKRKSFWQIQKIDKRDDVIKRGKWSRETGNAVLKTTRSSFSSYTHTQWCKQSAWANVNISSLFWKIYFAERGRECQQYIEICWVQYESVAGPI